MVTKGAIRVNVQFWLEYSSSFSHFLEIVGAVRRGSLVLKNKDESVSSMGISSSLKRTGVGIDM